MSNFAAYALASQDGDVTRVAILTFWKSMDAVGAFAGDRVDEAKYYDVDRNALLKWNLTRARERSGVG